MARLAVTFTVIFLLFAFISASTPLDVPASAAVDRDSSNSLPESEMKPILRLPGQKSESDPTTVVEIEPETTDPKLLDTLTQPIESAENQPEFVTVSVDTVLQSRPSNLVSFRPINRHFIVKRKFPFRIPLRPCRHHMKQMNPHFHRREIPYGDDMILSGESSDFDPMMFHGSERQIPRWGRFHHHHHHHHHHHEDEDEDEHQDEHEDGMPRFPIKHHAKEKFKRSFHHEEEERENGKERNERKEGGFMKSFREFLNHF